MKTYAGAFLLLFLSLTLYFVNISAMPYFNRLYALVRSAVYPLFEVKGKLTETTERTLQTYIFLKRVSEENQRLRRELEEYRLYKAQLLACENALKSLSKAVNFPVSLTNYSLVYTEAIAYDPSGRDAFVLISRGQDAGISAGMLVFSGEDLVGIVDEVYGSSSRVRTVFSEDFTLSASVKEGAYIYRGGFPLGSLLHVKTEDEISVGDVVYLRIPGKLFPQLRIGTVQRIYEDKKGFFKSVEVKPSVNIRKSPVLVVIREKI